MSPSALFHINTAPSGLENMQTHNRPGSFGETGAIYPNGDLASTVDPLLRPNIGRRKADDEALEVIFRAEL